MVKLEKTINYNLMMMIGAAIFVLPSIERISFFYIILAAILILFAGFNAHKFKKWKEMNRDERIIFMLSGIVLIIALVYNLYCRFILLI